MARNEFHYGWEQVPSDGFSQPINSDSVSGVMALGDSCGGVIREFRQSLLGFLGLHEAWHGLESKYEVGKSGEDSISEGGKDSPEVFWSCMLSARGGWFFPIGQGALTNP